MNGQPRFQPLARALLRTQSDERLVALTREGRNSAFDEIARRYRPALVAFAAAYAPREAAEDVVQESLAAAWRTMRDSSTEIHLKPWLYTIVRNRALNASRDARPHEQLDEHVDGVSRPDEVALTREELGRVVAAIGALPAMQRQALVRSALEGRTHEQIAAELGSSVGGVAQLIFRARTTVRSGVGLIIPLPVLRALLEPAGQAATGAAGAGATAAAAGGGGGLIAKGAAVALIGVAAAGSGIALHDSKQSGKRADAVSVQSGTAERPTSSSHDPATAGESELADDRGGEPEPGDDRGGGTSSGPGGGEDNSGPSGGASSGPGGGGEVSGHEGGESSGPGGGESSGPGGGESSGSGGGDSSGPGGGEDNSGPGGGESSGHDGGSSGPGGGGPGPSPEVEETTTITTTPTTTTESSEGSEDGESGPSGSGSSGPGLGSGGSGGGSGPD
jgi:RNA polymerase sigma factor (sigma-70 family)